MNPSTTEHRNHRASPLLWIAGTAVGLSVGAASGAYARRRRSRWDTAKAQAVRLAEYAREEVKPWIGVAAGTATAVAKAMANYTRRRRSHSQRAVHRASAIISESARSLRPWAGVALKAVLSLACGVQPKGPQKRHGRDAKWRAERLF